MLKATDEELTQRVDSCGDLGAATSFGPFGYSTASSRYEGASKLPRGKHDRNQLLFEWVGERKRVLEVGCSTGYMSRELRGRGCSVTGIEVDPIAAEKSRAYCHKVYVLDLNSPNWTADLPESGFDVVLLGDVLEHLIAPDAALQHLRKVLSPEGKLVISLPNVVHWVTRLEILFGQFNYRSWGTLDHTHLRFFTTKTARALIEAAGYRVTKFQPVTGGRLSGHAQPAWRWLARALPGLFAYQMLFEAKWSSKKA